MFSTDEQYNPDLTSGSEGTEDALGDFTKRGKKKAKSTAKSSTGKGLNPSLKPIEEKYVIGKAAPLPWNDLENDSCLIKPKTYDPVV